jgi:hypothetical protein
MVAMVNLVSGFGTSLKLMRSILLFLMASTAILADVRYQLRCEIESSDKVVSKSGALADAMKDCSSEILQTADRQMIRNGKSSQIIEFGTETTILVDHVKQTWTKNGAGQADLAAQAAMEQLKQMGAVFKMTSNLLEEKKQIAGFESKGMASLLNMSFNFPGMDKGMSSVALMEFWVSETAPGAKEILAYAAKNGPSASPTMRMMGQFLASVPGGNQLLKDGSALIGQLMEMTMTMETKGLADTLKMKMTLRAEGFDEKPIPASEFAIPAGYKEVK